MNSIDFKKLVRERVIILDGAMGTELHKRGFLNDVNSSEELNLHHPERLTAVYNDYLEAGAEVILANTFGANRLKLKDYNLEDQLERINKTGISIAREAAGRYGALVAADMSSLGSYLQPLGSISFDLAYETFAEQVRSFKGQEPDLIVIETMAEIREVKAALLAAKDNFDGPVLVQMTFTADGTSVTGTDVLSFLSVAESMGADGVGMNCSVGPKDLVKLATLLARYTTLPISFKPNAGMPRLVNRETVFPGTVDEFVAACADAYAAGINLLGGCCGTTPAFIKALAQKLKGKPPAKRFPQEKIFLSSRTKTLDLAQQKDVVFIGERINPTNRKKFQEELLAGNFATLRREAQEQVRSGAQLLDLNLGLPNADEKALMTRAVEEIQETVDAPLCLDSSSSAVLEAGIRACAGKPIINSVNGDDEKLDRVLPLARRYGACVIGLTTDERGLPRTKDERLAIATRILAKAKEHGLPGSEIIIDYLTLSASAMAEGIPETLAAIKESKLRWPKTKTVLGVSNVSFGLPARQVLNSTFLKLARAAGLDMAICNPHEDWSIDDELARDVLLGKDKDAKAYIAKYGSVPKKAAAARETAHRTAEERLRTAVVDGNREEIDAIVQEVLAGGRGPLEVANDILLVALNEVGEKFNKKEFFLPQVIRAAEAAQIAFARIKPLLKKEAGFTTGKIVLATVKGDVHDIGKNIVAAVLESHGWEVIDLGKNIDSETIVAAAQKEGCTLIGLSALMTTTMLEMEKVVQERNRKGLKIKILIGGAPVTSRFANEIGADGYAKDAVAAAQLARELTCK
jgi:5-methyltetrahydrofolate--homocysteine methyltransferase